ncbi:MAG: hypothetical protein HF973_10660 [Chloroflexi bacterium]|nr:hypothetical protein [Chloroflexota bacterium]
MTKDFSAWLIFLFLLAVLLTFSTLGRNSLWFDEAWSVFRARQPVETALAGNIDLGRPPLYYIALHYWIDRFGSGEISVRLPSVLAYLFSTGLVYLLGLQLSNRGTALAAMSLLALSPLYVWYAQEVRMYIFIAALGLIAANGLVWGRWLAVLPVTAALTAGLYVDFPMIPLWIGLSAAFLVYWQAKDQPARPFFVWLVSTIFSILLYQPWWSRAAALLKLLNNIHVFRATRQVLRLPEFSAGQYAAMILAAGAGLVFLFWLAYKLFRQDRIRRILTPPILILFLALTVAFVWPRFFGVKRVLATGWPYVCLFIAWLVAAWEEKRRIIWYGLMGVSLAATLVMLLAVPKDDWRGAVAYVTDHARVGDVVWIDPAWNNVAWSYYQPEIPAYSGSQEQLEQLAVTDVWLVAERFPGQAAPSSPDEVWLDENLQLVESIPFYRLEVRHYRPN